MLFRISLVLLACIEELSKQRLHRKEQQFQNFIDRTFVSRTEVHLSPGIYDPRYLRIWLCIYEEFS